MRKLLVIIIAGMSLTLTNCASYKTYQTSKKEYVTRTLKGSKAPNKEVLLKEIGDGKFENIPQEIQPSFLETLKERPYWQAGAGVLDVASAFLLKKGIEDVTGSGDSNNEKPIANSGDKNIAGANNIITQGNNNSITITTESTPSGEFDGSTPELPINQ